jgi:Alpha-L-fucosidase
MGRRRNREHWRFCCNKVRHRCNSRDEGSPPIEPMLRTNWAGTRKLPLDSFLHELNANQTPTVTGSDSVSSMKVRWRSAGRKSRFLFAIGFTFLLADWRLRAQEPLSIAEKMQWFQHDKLGMFIHWGPYSYLAGEWNGQQIPVGTEAEWIMQRFNIPVAEYREMAHRRTQYISTRRNGWGWRKPRA